MVDLILLTFVGIFPAGSWTGFKYKRPSELLKAMKAWFNRLPCPGQRQGHHAGALPQDAAAMENYMTLSEISGVSPIYKLQKTK